MRPVFIGGGLGPPYRVVEERLSVMAVVLVGLVGVMVWGVVFPLGVLAFGVPASLLIVAKQSRGGLVAFGGWLWAVQVGWLPWLGGPLGVPSIVFWPLTVLFGVWWALGLGVMCLAAFRHAAKMRKLVDTFGMPWREVF